MILIVCVDDNNGMMFNNRRQSRDSELIKRVEALTEGKKLWTNEYSKTLFNRETETDEEFLNKAVENEFCFNETVSDITVSPQKVIFYKWNRKYPSDKKFSFDMSCMKLVSSFEFKGSSHEKITEEVYERI